ncbi:MAG: hypothetical protein QNJ97_07985 [Myxococcota bacterium]|nr:hypothetical protein [Myxococcota bacterium]
MGPGENSKYARKHPNGAKVNEIIAQDVKKHMVNGRLSCESASRIATVRCIAMSEVGRTADLLEVRLTDCFLGLFGMTPDGKKIKPVQPLETVPKDLEMEIARHLEDGHLTCARAWDIAKRLGILRQTVASACESNGTKISRCQLGAF